METSESTHIFMRTMRLKQILFEVTGKQRPWIEREADAKRFAKLLGCDNYESPNPYDFKLDD